MTKYHISMELNIDVDDATPDSISYLADKFMTATGFAWVNPELGSNEPYKAFRREDTENVLIGTLLIRPIDRWFKTSEQQLQELRSAIEKIAYEHNWYLNSRHLPDMIKALVENAGREGDTAVKEMKSILDTMIAYFRGMEIAADMVGNGSTHAEKNARLRGLLEVIGTAIDRATEFSYEFGARHYPNHLDLFKSDYAVRDIMRQLHEKDAEIKRLKVAAGEAKPEDPQADGEPDENDQTFTSGYRRGFRSGRRF